MTAEEPRGQLLTKKQLATILGVSIFGSGVSYQFCPTPAPGPEPTPTATAEPSVEPTGTPAPLPTPSPAPTVALCVLPPSSVPQSGCLLNPSGLEFREDIEEAQRLAAANGFVTNGIVNDEIQYTREVARIMRVMGYCAISGADAPPLPPDEVIAKDSNAFSAHWDLVQGGSNNVLTLAAARCSPSKF